ncbi:MAG: hypothetical protein UF067_04640, partial [Paludibacteraceae bacterium]|nr:hypothetical protein [Paludibacteraceae bacterium]
MKRLLPNIEMKRIIVTILALMMMAGGAYAQYSGGSGTKEKPYEIGTAEDLVALSNYFSGKGDKTYYHYELVNDIDMAGETFVPIGGLAVKWDNYTHSPSNRFVGHFNGGGHVIKNLKVSVIITSQKKCIGFFGIVGNNGGTTVIESLTVE